MKVGLVIMTKKNKKEMKQFFLIDKVSCTIYLQRIIATTELCLERLKRYNKETQQLLDKYSKNDKIPYLFYLDHKDRTSNVISYLLNILGDSQKTSISYFKYRKQVEGLVKKGVEGISYTPFPDEIKELIQEFNKMRNWGNHIPESLLISEIEMIKEGKYLPHTKNPIQLNEYKYVSYEYMNDLYTSNHGFYEAARKLAQYCKKDYSLLIDESMRITRVYIEKPLDVNSLEFVKLSSKIQGIKGEF